MLGQWLSQRAATLDLPVDPPPAYYRFEASPGRAPSTRAPCFGPAPPSDDEDMDMSSSRKRARETESEDEEPTGRRKQPSSSPPSPEQHTADSCHVQQPDHGSAISPQSGETAATSSPPAAQDGGPPGRASTTSRHPAESTAAASAAPQSKGAPGTILNAPSAPDGGASTAAPASEPATNESAADEMELTDATPTVSSHQGPDHPAARFLKDPPCQPASRPKPKGQKKKQKKRKEQLLQRVTPSARESTTYDFTLVQSKRDRRRARALETAALPVDPAVVVTGRLPAERGKSTGFLHGVVGLPADTDLLGAIESSVPVLSATREESTITIRFAGPVPPEHVRLFKLGFRMADRLHLLRQKPRGGRLLRESPLQELRGPP
nr:nascent polypeptide-associated complex subunit alpha, muscle-specific form-like [Dermacentor andersoni]